MYCPDCKIEVESGEYCPLCGRKLVRDSHNTGTVVDDSFSGEAAQVSGKKRCKFNFSKPLCAVFALLLILSLAMPWFHLNVKYVSANVVDDRLTILQLKPQFSYYCGMVSRLAGTFGTDMNQYADLITAAEGILLAAESYFMLCGIHFLLFGIIGLFSRGKLRYYFARVGSTMYIIGLLVLIIAVLIGNAKLGAAVAAFGAQNELQISASVKLTAHPYIALAAALVFRIFGIRLLRYLNGVSCLNRGITDIAKREFSLIHCVKRVPKTYSKPKHRGRTNYTSYGDTESFNDGIVD